MAKDEKLFTVEQGATLTGLTLSCFRAKVRKLGIKGQKLGRRVYFSEQELGKIRKGISTNASKAARDKLEDYKGHNADYLLARRLKKT